MRPPCAKLDRRLPQLLLLTLASAAGIFSRSSLGPLQESIRLSLALDDNEMALLQGPSLALPLVLLAIPLGIAIDRFPRRRLILLFALLNLAGSVGTAFAPSFGWLFAARCLIGFTGTATWITAIALLADLYPEDHRGRATMTVTIGAAVGMSAAFALGGELLSLESVSSGSWHAVALWLSAPLVLVLGILLCLREPLSCRAASRTLTPRELCARLWPYRAVAFPLIIGLAITQIADGAAAIWAGPLLLRRFDLAPSQMGALMGSILLGSGVLGPLVGGFTADACQRSGGPKRTVKALMGMTILSIPAGLFGIAPTVAWVSLSLEVFMIVGVAFNVAVPSLVTIVMPADLRGVCMALMSGTSMLSAFGLAPLTVSYLSGALGGPSFVGHALAAVCVASSLIGAITFASANRYFPEAINESQVA